MTAQVLAAVRTGAHKTEFRKFPMPEVPVDGALLKMEVAGICGTDVKFYAKPPIDSPVIMGHENIGYIAKAGRQFVDRKDVKEGDLVFVEHYVPVSNANGATRANTACVRARTGARILMPCATAIARLNARHICGAGLRSICFCLGTPWVHKVPHGVSPELAGVVTPMANGIQWALFECEVGYNSRVLIQGPGQQGLSQTVTCKQAGASLIIVTGTSKDKARLERGVEAWRRLRDQCRGRGPDRARPGNHQR